GQLDHHVLRTRRIGRDVRQIDYGLLARRQLDLGFFGSLFQALYRQRIALEVDTAVFLELIRQVIDEDHVEIFTTHEGVAVGRQLIELLLAVDIGDLDDRNIEGAAAAVIHSDDTIAVFLVDPVGQRSSGRLIDDAFYFETGRTA